VFTCRFATNATESRVGTIGKKLPNIEIRIAEPNEQGVGELQVRGRSS
jgi:long-subunit acyl-CoA synthetase (AMP-forming)